MNNVDICPSAVVRAGILGAAGYTGGELIRLLVNHPNVEIAWANSESGAGKRVADVHDGLTGDTELYFTDELDFEAVDVLFFCFGHGKSADFIKQHAIPERVRIIDLAQDFRLSDGRHDYVYGLPELQRERIRTARHIANPGCFATCIQLGLLPLAQHGMLQDDITVNAVTGSTGAGQKPTATTHFSWRNNNISTYKAFEHQHVPEICQSIGWLQGDFDYSVDFIPYRGDFARGILATSLVYVPAELEEEKIIAWYRDFYADAPFTHYSERQLDLKQVVNTNKCLVHVEKHANRLLITSVIDNLLKGAVGQAVQNMNLMLGLDETAGLRLKASAF